MKLSMKSRYAFRALADLAIHSKSAHVPLNVLAQRNGISPQFLEQVFASLRRAGIVRSIKGPQEGIIWPDRPVRSPSATLSMRSTVIII